MGISVFGSFLFPAARPIRSVGRRLRSIDSFGNPAHKPDREYTGDQIQNVPDYLENEQHAESVRPDRRALRRCRRGPRRSKSIAATTMQ